MSSFNLLDVLCWLFVIGVFINIGFSVFVLILTNKQIETEKERHKEFVKDLRKEYRQDFNDLCDRLMAESYSEYESYKQSEQKKKPTSGNNFIKKSIDIAEQNYIRERQGLEED